MHSLNVVEFKICHQDHMSEYQYTNFQWLLSCQFFVDFNIEVGIDNSKSIDSLLLSVLSFVNNLFDNCIVLCRSYSIFF
jgi:hypothetical protein